jgi:dTDP-4-dehydrorhamnose reductase/thiamine kinase-like enzyme
MFKRFIALFVIISFILSYYQPVYAQDFSINQLPVPGTMVGESAPFAPLALKGLVINLQKPLEFQFIVDTGKGPQDTASVKDQAIQLVKYFLAGLTIPEGDLWVNLSPYERNRMVPEALGQTDLGRDLLAQDYILKQLAASLIYPEKDLGKEFWSRVYAKAQQQFGTTNVPVNTFNKVWILPDQAQVFEHGTAAYVTKATLKVMLDEDYLALQKHMPVRNGTDSIGSQVVRQIILPEIEKEVNTGKNFAPLRQIYQALILAKWYKETIQNGLLDAVYTNKNKVAGVNLNDPAVKEQIYNRYLQAYKKGAFNYIKEDPTPDGQVMPRKYFSGGLRLMPERITRGPQSDIKGWDGAMISIDINLKKSNDQAQSAVDISLSEYSDLEPWVDKMRKIVQMRINSVLFKTMPQVYPSTNGHRKVFYPGSGADVSSFMIGTNATEGVFITGEDAAVGDKENFRTMVSQYDFESYLSRLYDQGSYVRFHTLLKSNVLYPMILELFAIGVKDVRIVSKRKNIVDLIFQWKHPDDTNLKERHLIVIAGADLNNPENFLDLLPQQADGVFLKALTSDNEFQPNFEGWLEKYLSPQAVIITDHPLNWLVATQKDSWELFRPAGFTKPLMGFSSPDDVVSTDEFGHGSVAFLHRQILAEQERIPAGVVLSEINNTSIKWFHPLVFPVLKEEFLTDPKLVDKLIDNLRSTIDKIDSGKTRRWEKRQLRLSLQKLLTFFAKVMPLGNVPQENRAIALMKEGADVSFWADGDHDTRTTIDEEVRSLVRQAISNHDAAMANEADMSEAREILSSNDPDMIVQRYKQHLRGVMNRSFHLIEEEKRFQKEEEVLRKLVKKAVSINLWEEVGEYAISLRLERIGIHGGDRLFAERTFNELKKRLKQRELIDWTEKKWLDRLDYAYWWYKNYRDKYTEIIPNIYGEGEGLGSQKEAEVALATEKFRKYMEGEAEKGKKFFIYSGGSGVGKSTMWNWLTERMPKGKYEFKKFLMYTTRERRQDENKWFKKDLSLDENSELYKVFKLILDNNSRLPDSRLNKWDIHDVNIRNLSDYLMAFNIELTNQESQGLIKLSDMDKEILKEVFNLSLWGKAGLRIENAPEKRGVQPLEISLAERIGWAKEDNGSLIRDSKGNVKIRVFGEFDGVSYYFTDESHLNALAIAGKVTKFIVLGGLVQGISIPDVISKLESKMNEIYVLETTPENLQELKKDIRMQDLISFFISPFDAAQLSENIDYTINFEAAHEAAKVLKSTDPRIIAMRQKTIVVVGASGFLGKKIVKTFQKAQVPVFETGFTKSKGLYQLDVTNDADIRVFVNKVHPDVIVYAAAEADPSRTQKDDARARQLNVDAVGLFAKYFDGRFLYFSSDYVFDGTSAPYSVNAPTNAVNKYGETKIDGEGMMRQSFGKNATILRLGLLYGYNDENDRETFVQDVIRKLDDGIIIEADNQYVRHPVLVDDVANTVLDVVKNERSGILHINGDIGVTKFQLAQIIADEYVRIFPQGGEEYKIKGLVVEKSENGIAKPQNAQLLNSVVPTDLRDGIRRILRLISRRLKGGSFNKTDIFVKDGMKIVRKQALPNENGKLVNQIKYLLSVPESVKQYFPEVLDYSLGDEKVRDDERVRIQVEQIEKKLGQIGYKDVIEEVMRHLKDGTLVFKGKEVNVRADENAKSFLGRVDENIAKFLRYSYLIDKDAEVLDVVDPMTGNPTGEKAFRGDIHRKGLWHGVVHILVVNENTGKILTQVRAIREDINSSGKMDISAGGHIPSGMKPDEVAIKEGTEEIKLAPGEFKILKVGDNFRASGSSKEAGDRWDRGTFYYKTSQNNNEVASLYIALTQVSAEELNKRIVSVNESGAHADEQEVGRVNYVAVNDLRDRVLNENQRDQMASPLRMYFGLGKELNNILQLIDNARKREEVQFIDIPAVFNNIPHDSVRPKIFYDMPYYQGKTLTNMIMDGDINAQQARLIVEKVMKVWSDDLVQSSREIAPGREYIQKQLIDRTRQSLDQVRREAPEVFEKVLVAPFIVINGKRYKNALPLLQEISANKRLMEMLSPPRFLFTHGDFHFDNIFVTEDGSFKFIDPRGDFQGDPIYDLAKIAHTLEAKYDILNHDLEQTRLTVQDGQIEITVQYPETTNAWKIYDELERLMPEILQKAYVDTGLANKDPFWKERLLFSLAKIMTNLPIYHLKHDGKEERALALYAEGVKILNDFAQATNKLSNKNSEDKAMQQLNPGGIDLNQINVNRTGKTINVQFDPAQLNELEQSNFKGFTPVITGFEYIKSPFPLLLGINTTKQMVEPERLAKV